MKTSKAMVLVLAGLLLTVGAWAQGSAPLRLIKSVSLPSLHDGDFDHFAVDLPGKRLFSAAEENSKALVFDLNSGVLLHTFSDLSAPHSMVYRNDLHKLFIVDGDLGVVRMYDGVTYKNLGDIKLRPGADSSIYDPATHYLYVITGGADAKLPNAYLTVVDTTSAKEVADIQLDSDDVEAMALEKAGPRLFVDIRGNNAVEVFDRNTRKLLHTWPVKAAAKPSTIAFDEANHRLMVGTRSPGKLIVMNSDTGAVLSSLPAASLVDDMAFGAAHKRIYFAGSNVLDVFQQRDADHFTLLAHVPTGYRAKTGILVPQLDRFYLGVPHHGKQVAELRIYQVVP